MAMMDWNDDGKNDIWDDFLEYEICRDGERERQYLETMHESREEGTNGGGGNALFAVLVAFSGIIIQALFYTICGIDVDNVPGLIVVFLWIFIDVIVLVVLSSRGEL